MSIPQALAKITASAQYAPKNFHALASQDAPTSSAIDQCQCSSFLVFATMKFSCVPHNARLILRLLRCSCRNNVESTSIVVSAHTHLPRNGEGHISILHRLLAGYENASYSEPTIHLSSRCAAFIEHNSGVVILLPATVLVRQKHPDLGRVVDPSQHLLHIQASNIRPGCCKEAQHVPYALSGEYVLSNEVDSVFGVHYVLSPCVSALFIGPRLAMWAMWLLGQSKVRHMRLDRTEQALHLPSFDRLHLFHWITALIMSAFAT